MKQGPLNPKLPGRYGKMTREELNAVVASLDRPVELSETRALTAGERRAWLRAKRRPGRPRRGKGAKVISLSVEESLLDRADRTARRAGISRAALFEMGLRAVLTGKHRKAG